MKKKYFNVFDVYPTTKTQNHIMMNIEHHMNICFCIFRFALVWSAWAVRANRIRLRKYKILFAKLVFEAFAFGFELKMNLFKK